jgi:DNA-binding beta-propeller fold protein YncE
VTWDPVHSIVGVSDQRDGAVSLIRDAGTGVRTRVQLGAETGNVVFDPTRATLWITVVQTDGVGEVVEIDPTAATVKRRIALPGCDGAHGLRIHPDGQSAFVACEGNSLLERVELGETQRIVSAQTGAGPDVLSIDPGLGWIYVAAESGDLTVFDLKRPGLIAIDHERVGPLAHTVAVDPSNHQVFFPLPAGPTGTPILRIMEPKSHP